MMFKLEKKKHTITWDLEKWIAGVVFIVQCSYLFEDQRKILAREFHNIDSISIREAVHNVTVSDSFWVGEI